MKNLLVVNASGRVTRSITRRLTERFTKNWIAANPGGRVVYRDVGQHTPPAVDETWIAAAFTAPPARTTGMLEALKLSDRLVDEIVKADAIVIGSPIYNFGMPAALKAYIDQIVRAGLTFSFEANAAEPYQPLLISKPVFVLIAAGDGALLPDGPLAHLNFLEPHLATALGFIGLTDVRFVRVGYEEYQDDRLKRSFAKAESLVDEHVSALSV